jgi:hypothetical protein
MTNTTNAIRSGEESTILDMEDGTIHLGHLLSLLVISEPDPHGGKGLRQIRKGTLDVEIAAFLGMHHFNQRSGAVISNLPKRLKNCNIFFTMDLRDSQGTPRQSSRQLLDAVNGNQNNAGSNTTAISSHNAFPTGIVGTGRSTTASPISILGSVFSVPQLSCCATSRDIGGINAPLFARTVPTNQQDAIAAAEYLKRSWKLTHVGVIFVQGPYGEQFAADFRKAANALGIAVVSAGYYESDPASVDGAIERIRQSRIQYIFGIFYQDNLSKVMKSADTAGLVGNGYTWLFSESLNRLAGSTLFFDKDEDKEIIKAVNGSGVILLSVPANDRFDQAILDFRADDELKEYYISRHKSPELFDGFNLSESDPLRSTYFAQLNYDASIALGLAACEAESQFPNGAEVFDSLLRTEFEGSSGPVRFNRISASRSHLGLQFKVMNIKAEETNSEGQVFITARSSAVVEFLSPGVVREVEPFVFADGSTQLPANLPDVDIDMNKIPGPVIASGLTLCGLLILTALAWIWWVVHYRRKNTVRAAQPLFLVILCVGTLILASSIIPMSFQEPMSYKILNVGCMAVPWLTSIGFTTAFSALFSKLWRIGRLHEASAKFQKVNIKVHHVLLPFAVLMTLNVAVLTTWTITSPLKWTRSPHPSRNDNFGRSIESFGQCHGDDATLTAAFTWSLMLVNFVSLAIAIVQSYRTRNLPSMFNESLHIVLSLLSMLEASIMGVPLLWFVADFPTASYIVRTGMVSIFCLAIILPIFIPKARFQRNPVTGRFSVEVAALSRADGTSSFNRNQGVGSSYPTERRGALVRASAR